MNALILNDEKKLELADLNESGSPERQLGPVALVDGRFALNADLLTDCGPGQTWEHYGGFLQSLPEEEITLEQFQ